jgi:hypothetical protein
VARGVRQALLHDAEERGRARGVDLRVRRRDAKDAIRALVRPAELGAEPLERRGEAEIVEPGANSTPSSGTMAVGL